MAALLRVVKRTHSWGSVLTAALVDFYWREPGSCSLGNLPPVRKHDDDDSEDSAA
jgi:hypothetical protein